MSTIAFLRELLAEGMDLQAALIAAERFELHCTPPSNRDGGRVWVYVMGADHPGADLVKIGISKHPNHRLLTLERERGANLYLAHTEGPFSRLVAAAAERRAHDALAAQRETGEWFLCGCDMAIEVVRAYVGGAVR